MGVTECFRCLDRDNDGILNHEEVGILFRALGQTPTDDELAAALAEKPPAGLDLTGFADFFSANYHPPTTEDTVLRAFKVFDPEGTGVVNVELLREALSTSGLQHEQVDALLEKAASLDENGQQHSYKFLAQHLCEGPKVVGGSFGRRLI